MENCFEYRRVFILFCIDEAAFDLSMLIICTIIMNTGVLYVRQSALCACIVGRLLCVCVWPHVDRYN